MCALWLHNEERHITYGLVFEQEVDNSMQASGVLMLHNEKGTSKCQLSQNLVASIWQIPLLSNPFNFEVYSEMDVVLMSGLQRTFSPKAFITS